MLSRFGVALFCITTTVASLAYSPRNGPADPETVGRDILSHLKSQGALDKVEPNVRPSFEAGILEAFKKQSGQTCAVTSDPLDQPRHRQRLRRDLVLVERHQTGVPAPEVVRHTPLTDQWGHLARRTEGPSSNEDGESPAPERGLFRELYDTVYNRGYFKGKHKGLLIGMCMGDRKCHLQERLGRHVSWEEITEELAAEWYEECEFELEAAEESYGSPDSDPDNLNKFATGAVDIGSQIAAPLSALAVGAVSAIGSSAKKLQSSE